MVRKKLAMAVLALTALQAGLASALGLGNLSVKSALNQPLNAEIKLLDTGDLDPTQIKVQLATPEDFERAGVDRNFFLTNLKFAVDIDGRGTGTIRITTHDPVVEPYLNFVVEARWPNGRLLREFAVLLDPPTFSGGAAQPAPRASAPAPRATRDIEPPKVTTAPAAPSTAERIESNTLPDAGGASEHRVQVGETLSKIAAQHRPGSATVQQTMVAIQRANPEAFINSNINLIKSGAILRLPSADDTNAVGAAEANQQIAQQTHAWRTGGSGEPASGPQLDASQPPAAGASGPQDQGRLTIATPGNSDKATVGEGSGKGSGKGLEALRNQLAASQETLDSAKRDNKELQSRLDDMERQVATLNRLISLKDEQLAALQVKAAQQGQTAAATPTAPAQEPPAQAPTASQPATTETTPAPAATPPVPVPQPAAKPPVAAKPVKKPVAPAPEPSLLDKLTSEPLYWGGALGALALLLGGALVAKKRREQAEEESSYQELDLDDYTDANEDLALDDNALISDEAIPAVEAPVAVEPEKKPLRSETGDAIAEADIYIAYGRYQQAVDLLTSAIDHEPERADLRVKLLEVYLEMRNRDAFRQQFMALQSLGNSAAIGQVKEMLSSVDGVSDWLNDLPQPAVQGGGDFAAVAALAAGASAAAVAADDHAEELSLDDDLDLDLNLDGDLDEPAFVARDVAPVAELPSEPLEDLELDLDDDFGTDLDLGDSDNVVASAADELAAFEPEQPALDDVSAIDESAIDLDLDLDDEELDLELNEEDLDYALRAMEGGGDKADAVEPAQAAPFVLAPSFAEQTFTQDSLAKDLESAVAEPDTLAFEEPVLDLSEETSAFEADTTAFEAPSFEVPAFETPSVDVPSFETDSLSSVADDLGDDFTLDLDDTSFETPVGTLVEAPVDAPMAGAPAAHLDDFDLSLAEEEFAAENTAADVAKMEEDLGDLSELGDLDDFSFDSAATTGEFAAPVAAPVAEAVSAPVPELSNAVGDDFDFLADTDEVATKLDLARAYIDMGDTDGARDILDEVLQEGSDVQRQEASELLGRIA